MRRVMQKKEVADNCNKVLNLIKEYPNRSYSQILKVSGMQASTFAGYIRRLRLLGRIRDLEIIHDKPVSINEDFRVLYGKKYKMKKISKIKKKMQEKRIIKNENIPILKDPITLSMTTTENEIDGEMIHISPEALAKLIKLLR